MKKIFAVLSLIMVLGLGSMLYAASGASLKVDGGTLRNGNTLGLTEYPGAMGTISVKRTAVVNITKGMPVVVTTNTTYYDGVSLTATAGDQTWLGIALETATFGSTINIAISGSVAAYLNMTGTVGVAYSTAGSAGALTPTSTITSGIMTPLSRTPIILYTSETKIPSSDGLVRCFIAP